MKEYGEEVDPKKLLPLLRRESSLVKDEPTVWRDCYALDLMPGLTLCMVFLSAFAQMDVDPQPKAAAAQVSTSSFLFFTCDFRC